MPAVAPSGAWIRHLAGPLESVTIGAWTIAAVLQPPGVTRWAGFYGWATSGGSTRIELNVDSGNQLRLYNGGSEITSTYTFGSTDGWCLLVANKAAGTTTPRCHKFQWNTGAWTHQNMSGSIGDSSSMGAGGYFQFGANPRGESWQSSIAAGALWLYSMSDGEVERLTSGLWDRWTPAHLVELPGNSLLSGNDWHRDLGRYDLAYTTTGSPGALTRSTFAGPPGFRFTPRNLRG